MTDIFTNSDEQGIDTNRRSALRGIGFGAASLGGLATTGAASADGTNVLTVQATTDETAHYTFTISGTGTVEKSERNGGTINDYDSIDGTEVSGRTTHEPDSFEYDGGDELDSFEADAPVYVEINDIAREDVAPEAQPSPDQPTQDQEDDQDESDEDNENEDENREDERVDASEYDEVVELDVEDGEDITGDIEAAADDGTLIRVPAGTYEISPTARITGLDQLGLVGQDATLNVQSTDDYLLKLGVYYDPISDLHVEGFDIDLTGDDTGGRVFELQAGDSLGAYDLTFNGRHDTTGGLGPMLAGLRSSDGEGMVENVDLSDGGLRTFHGGAGGTGLLVSHYHEGELTIRDVTIGPFPDNGLYCSNGDGDANGTVHVEDSEVRNANVAGIRLAGTDSSIENCNLVYNEDIDDYGGQRPIRVDDGSDLVVEDTAVHMSIDGLEAIRVLSDVESLTVTNCTFDLSRGVRDAISIVDGADGVDTSGNSISGQSRYDVFRY